MTHALVLAGVPELRPQWEAYVDAVLTEPTLARPHVAFSPTGGRDGRHEHLAELLGELQSLHREIPAATW